MQSLTTSNCCCNANQTWYCRHWALRLQTHSAGGWHAKLVLCMLEVSVQLTYAIFRQRLGSSADLSPTLHAPLCIEDASRKAGLTQCKPRAVCNASYQGAAVYGLLW